MGSNRSGTLQNKGFGASALKIGPPPTTTDPIPILGPLTAKSPGNGDFGAILVLSAPNQRRLVVWSSPQRGRT